MNRAKNLIKLYDWETIVHFMNDDIRKKVKSELPHSTNEEFLSRYLELHKLIYGSIFTIELNPVGKVKKMMTLERNSINGQNDYKLE